MDSYRSHIKKNFFLAYPVMLSQLGHIMVGVADSMMVGQLGAVPLAAASLGNVIFHLLMAFGIGLSYAITPLVSSADGSGNTSKIAALLRHGTIINGAGGVILFLLIFLGAPVLYYLNQPPDVVELAIPYLFIVTFSLIPLMFFQTYRQFAEGLSFTKQAMVIVIVSNLINVFLNYILIFGKFGFPAMGLNGAGWATLIARFILAGWMAWYIYSGKPFQPFRAGFQLIQSYSTKMFRSLLKIGVPSGFQFIFEVGAFGFAAIMVGWLGAEALAAHQIAINLAAITYMTASGLSAAATIRVGNQRGMKDIFNLRRAAYTIYWMVFIFMGVCALIFIIGRNFLPSLYIDNEFVQQQAASLLIIAAFFQLSDGLQVVSLGALRGLEDVKIPTILTFIAYWILALPIGYFLGFELDLGAEGVWYGLLIGLTVIAIALLIRFNRLTKKEMVKELRIKN
ncbi:MAG: MATE family efflux transporter [Candidatus Cyclobacteriaceae bacterium M2_1C_046]